MSAATATTGAMDKTQKQASIDRPDRTPSTLARLLDYMVGGEQRSTFFLGVIVRFVALLGLAALPYITGEGINVITVGGSMQELGRWVLYGTIAGIVYLVFSFASDRMFARMATDGLYKLQTGLFSNLQTLSMGFFSRTRPATCPAM